MQSEDQGAADLDETDLAILGRVERDSDVNLEELSDTLDLSKSAIHYRLKKLKSSDVITSTSADVDPLALDLSLLFITEVSVAHEAGYAEDIGEALGEIDGVYQVYYTLGDTDFIVHSRVQNRSQMNELIDEIIGIDGVNETSSTFVMQEIETGDGTVGNMSETMIDNVIDDS